MDDNQLQAILKSNQESAQAMQKGFANLIKAQTASNEKAVDGTVAGLTKELSEVNKSLQGLAKIMSAKLDGVKDMVKDSIENDKKIESEVKKRKTRSDKGQHHQWKQQNGLMGAILKANKYHTSLWKRYEDAKAAREKAKERMAKDPNKMEKLGSSKLSDAFKSFKAGDLIKSISAGLVGLGALLAGKIMSAISAAWKATQAALPTALKAGAKNAAKTALRYIPLVGAVIGIAEAIADGIAGWTSSEDWGVTKISGFLGGFFAGSGEGGIVNAFTNAGKWAGIGATAGLVVPVVGPIVGGLIGAALGGILGWVGGKKLAEGFDKIGDWFAEKWDSLVVEPITKLYEALAPEWFKKLTFTWEDFFPPALLKLMRGDYIKVEFPEFSWVDIFPKFLQDFFSGTADAISESAKDWKWYNIFPEFLVKFFTGEYAKDEVKFSWYDLFPKFLQDIFSGVGKGFDKMVDNWKWYNIFPDFLVKLFRDTKVTVTDEAKSNFTLENLMSLEWWAKNFMPEFVYKLMYGRQEAKEKGEDVEFNWMALVPDWLKPAIASFQGLAKGFKESDTGKAIGEGIDATFNFADMVGESINAMIQKVKTWIGNFFTFDMKAVAAKFEFNFPNPIKLLTEKMLAMDMFKDIEAGKDYGFTSPIKNLKAGIKKIVADMVPPDEPKVVGRSGGLIPQRVTGDQVPAILHANEIVLAENSAKLFLQAAQMFARPEYANAIKDLVKTNSDLKSQTTDALLQAGAMNGGGDGQISSLMAMMAEQQQQTTAIMAQIPDAVMAGASQGSSQGARTLTGPRRITHNPHEMRPKH